MSLNRIMAGLFAALLLAALVSTACGNSATPTLSATTSSALAISTASLANGNVGISYSRTLQAVGGTAPYSWSLTQGSLPTGLSLSSKTGSISGMPLTPVSSDFTIQVVDSSGKTVSRAFSITIVGATAPLAIRTSDLLNAEIAINYTQTLQVLGGNSPYTWSISGGTLPDGLAIDSNTGVISGKPSKTGKFFFSPQIRDSKGIIATAALTITVVPTLSISTSQLDQADVGIDYNGSIAAADGVEKYTWSILAGSLPEGLTLDPATGTISGKPAAAGNYTFTVQLSDIWGASAASPYSIKVNEAIAITTTALPNAKVGAAYTQTILFKGGNGTVIWANAGGTLPDGMDFDGNTGAITGTPKTAGVFKFSAEVIDSFGASDLKDITITVNPAQ